MNAVKSWNYSFENFPAHEMSAPRHLLVIASQCDSMEPLSALEAVANEMHDVLLDPRMGACSPGILYDRSLLTGALSKEEVQRAVKGAIEFANSQCAVLCLVFIGHGFTCASDPTLYFMTKEAVDQERNSAINVSELLLEAADSPGIDGVVAVIDCCFAGAGVPDIARLNAGLRGGRSAISVLAASSAFQEAYDLSLSRQLAQIIRTGIAHPDVTDRIYLDWPLEEILSKSIAQQDVRLLQFGTKRSLWLARNLRTGSFERTSPEGISHALRSAVGAWKREREVPDSTDVPRLVELCLEAQADADSAAYAVQKIADSLIIAARTYDYVRGWEDVRVTGSDLRRAFAAVDRGNNPPEVSDAGDLRRMLEHVAVTASPFGHDAGRHRVVDFVGELVSLTAHEVDERTAIHWADAIGASAYALDRLAEASSERRSRALRLVIVLNCMLSEDWPESIDCWLLNEGSRIASVSLECYPDQAGVERAVLGAIDWVAEQYREYALSLRQIDVAAPTALLMQWRPEDISDGGPCLAADHDVRIHWSGRLLASSAGNLMRLRRRARSGDSPAEPIEWLEPADCKDSETIALRLVCGRLGDAVGFVATPDRRVVSILLPHLPILVWRDGDNIDALHRKAIGEYWHKLPGQFSVAYRDLLRLQLEHPLSELRAMWDDKEWLDFCIAFNGGK